MPVDCTSSRTSQTRFRSRWGRCSLLLALLLATFAAMGGWVSPVHAAIFNIACGDNAGLIAAITTANATPGTASTINLSASCTYTFATSSATFTDRFLNVNAEALPTIVNTAGITINGNGAILVSTGPLFPGYGLIGVAIGANLSVDTLTIRNFRLPGFVVGGGIDNRGTLTVTNSTFNANSAFYGSGIGNDGTVTVSGSTFSANTSSGLGGGILSYAGSVTVVNSTFSGNSVSYRGAGIAIEVGTAEISFSTFANNIGGTLGGGGALSVTTTASVKASVFATNANGNCLAAGVITDSGFNVSSDATCGFSAATSANNTDPVLGTLGNNGGPTQTIPLLTGSPAINLVPTASCTTVGGTPVAIDQRGTARPQGPACDSGAFEVVQVASTLGLASSQNPSTVGQSVTFTATVSCPGNTPTGTVTFTDGATTLGTGTLNGAGQATFTTSALAVGSHPITASYSGDANCTASTSTVLTQVVNQTAAGTTLISSANPSTAGQSVTFTATVSCPGNTPTGTVTFRDGATTLGTSALSTTGGVSTASFSTAALAAGSHPISATYAGDANCAASTSTVLTQVVNLATAGTTLVSSANPSTLGQSVTFTATVSCPGFTPTGTVTFKDGATTLGTSALSTTGGVSSASFSTAALAASSHPITATYAGDASCAASTSTVLTQVVNQVVAAAAPPADEVPLIVGRLRGFFFGRVTLKISITGCGTVSGDSGQPHQPGEFVTLTATPCTGSVFISFSGGGSGCDGRTVSQCVIVIPGGDLSVTANFSPASNSAPATDSSTARQLLRAGCNEVVTPASLGADTPVPVVVQLVQRTVVVSAGRFNNALHVFQFGYFSTPGAPLEFSTIGPLQSLFLCVQGTGSFSATGA